MKNFKKLYFFTCVLFLFLGSVLTTQAADRQFTKKTVVLKEGQTKTLTLRNSYTTPEIMYHDPETSVFSYEVLSQSKIKVTAVRAGIDDIYVSNGNTNISCHLVVMPSKNPDLKLKTTKKGTSVSYQDIRLTLPKVWKKYGYVILTNDDSISFHAKSSYRTGWYGRVFSVEWCSIKEYEKRKTYLPNYSFLKRNGNTVYYLTLPTDVQFNTENKKCARHYQAFDKTVGSIKKSFKVKPKTCKLPAAS